MARSTVPQHFFMHHECGSGDHCFYGRRADFISSAPIGLKTLRRREVGASGIRTPRVASGQNGLWEHYGDAPTE